MSETSNKSKMLYLIEEIIGNLEKLHELIKKSNIEEYL